MLESDVEMKKSKKVIVTTIFFILICLIGLVCFTTLRKVEEQVKEDTLEITEVTVGEYTKPEFNKEEINNFIDSYIDENECMSFEYDVTRIENDKISIFMNCGTPKNIIYNYKEKLLLSIEDLITSKEDFTSIIVKLLNLKYPNFVTEQANISDGIFHIKENEIIGYLSTTDYGDISIKINNNEIKDILTYIPKLDEEYENEKYELDPTKKTIAFSFDDGPSDYDHSIVEYLVDSHSTATFFMVGNRINNYKNAVNKIVTNGMEVGNHSYDHKYLGGMSKSNVLDEINKTSKIFNTLTGQNMTLFRAPYGVVNASYLKETGFPSIVWSVDTLDWQSRNKDKVYAKIMASKDGDIILMHSLYKSTADAVKMAIPELYKKGFQIVSISELYELKGKTLEAGKSYWSAK